MRWQRGLCLTALAFALTVPAGVALGVPKVPAGQSVATTASTSAPLVVAPIDAQVWPAQDGQQTTVILDVQLVAAQKLPARVRIPVPIGATVDWAGEIVGDDPNNDIQRSFALRDGAGGASYAEFTLEKSRRGQIEAVGIPITSQGGVFSTVVDYVQSVPTGSTTFTVRLSPGASKVKIEPSPEGAPEKNSSGESLYVLPRPNLSTGGKTTIKVSYSVSPATAAGGSSASSFTAIYIVLGVLLAGAIAMVAYLATRGSPSGAEDEADGVDEDEDVESEDGSEDDDEFEWGDHERDDEPSGQADAWPSDDPFDLGDE